MNKIRLVVASLLLGAATGFAQKPFNASGTGESHYSRIFCRSHGEEVWRYVLYVCHYGWQWGRFRSCTGVDQQGFCELDVDAHELAGQSLDMGSRCDAAYGWELLFFYCQPCMIHCGVSETPRGPWKNILGESEAVLVPDRFVTNAITLDGQTFVDDDGSVYLYWGTWGIYKGFGCGAGKLASDMKSFTETRLIPNTEATDFLKRPL